MRRIGVDETVNALEFETEDPRWNSWYSPFRETVWNVDPVMFSRSWYLVLLLMALAVPPPAAASDSQATEWVNLLHSQSRLVRGITHSDGAIDVGVQIKLDPGWKTYWRVPGDSGVPPEFDWSRSANVSDVAIEWPTPIRFRDQFGDNIGYKKEVVFPLRVMPGAADRPVSLKLTVYFAVCDDICAPVRADLALEMGPLSSTPRFAGLIARYRSLVPVPVAEDGALKIQGVEVVEAGDRVDLLVDVSHKASAEHIDLFVDGGKKIYLSTPKEVATATSGTRRFRMRVDGIETAKDLAGLDLRFVLASTDKRVVQVWRLR